MNLALGRQAGKARLNLALGAATGPGRKAVAAVGVAMAWLASVAAQSPAQRAAMPLPYAAALPDESEAPPVLREFRGVWIATVANIDWPSRPGLPAEEQRAELVALLDRAVQLRLNAVVLQVRPSGDAFYSSTLEPWSYYLTGAMGRPPRPAYDPLAFAVAEAHRRGLELHAWFNPYRARYRGDRSPAARTHVSRAMPNVVKRYGPYQWMDPGEASVRALTTRVIVDVVRRYDVDGVHLDDYFYPYPERDRRGREIAFPDDRSWTRYRRGGGKLARGDWRRQNVDLLVEALYREIKRVKPWVKFGISPFGIWRTGYPSTVRGLDAFDVLFADSRRWLMEGWVDYFTPQLYWAVGAPQQSYPALLDWWSQQNRRGRHLWPGNGTYKVTDQGSVRWPAHEIVDQIVRTRDQPGSGGNVHYNMSALTRDTDALAGRLTSGPYAVPALVPASPWLAATPPTTPSVSRADESGEVVLRIALATPAPPAGAARARVAPTPVRWWLVRARYADGWRARVVDALERVVRLPADAAGRLPDIVAVSAIDRAGVESVAAQPYAVNSAPAARAPGRRTQVTPPGR